MMTTLLGVLGAAVLFGVFAALRPRDRGESCTGHCAGCMGNAACDYRERKTAGAHHDRNT